MFMYMYKFSKIYHTVWNTVKNQYSAVLRALYRDHLEIVGQNTVTRFLNLSLKTVLRSTSVWLQYDKKFQIIYNHCQQMSSSTPLLVYCMISSTLCVLACCLVSLSIVCRWHVSTSIPTASSLADWLGMHLYVCIMKIYIKEVKIALCKPTYGWYKYPNIIPSIIRLLYQCTVDPSPVPTR